MKPTHIGHGIKFLNMSATFDDEVNGDEGEKEKMAKLQKGGLKIHKSSFFLEQRGAWLIII